MGSVFRALDDETRRLVLDELAKRDGQSGNLIQLIEEKPDAAHGRPR